MGDAPRFFAEWAWVGGAWARDVLLTANDQGQWAEVRVGCAPQDAQGAVRLAGAALPGIVDAHSHAFQRAMAGLTERIPPGQSDTFWSWRERMYGLALTISPAELEDTAVRLYGELLQSGYTHVCEFHYLHNDVDGRPYADPLDMSLALVRAARRAGIGLTLLPTLYMRSGFGAQGLRPEQRRFASTPESVLRIADAVRKLAGESHPMTLAAGVAVHSMRAVDPGALREITEAARDAQLPVHIHVSEQLREVEECVAFHGQRPIEWLLQNAPVDGRWNLVHATHASDAELEGVAAAGASIVICPTTEANLGDGVFDLPSWLRLRGTWSVGSDSQVSRSWVEELRLLEYSQRLLRRERNVAARAAGHESTAEVLFAGAMTGGANGAGLPIGGFQVGARADVCLLAGIPRPLPNAEMLLDQLIFSSPGAWVEAFAVAGAKLPAGGGL